MSTTTAARPYALTLAGLDPSGGAGLTADVKTLEALGVMGLSVATCLTVQHEAVLTEVEPVGTSFIQAQIQLLFERYAIAYCKIGLVPSWSVLETLLDSLRAARHDVYIIVDPIFRATAGYDFHQNTLPSSAVLAKIDLLTPNENELRRLQQGTESPTETAQRLAQTTCAVLYKGGHNKRQKGTDVLFTTDTSVVFEPLIPVQFDKHGSGCVLSAAITGYLALGATLSDACRLAKDYTAYFLNSTSGLLGYHHL